MERKAAILVYVDTVIHPRKLEEFKLLADAAGYEPRIVITQEREPDSRFYVGVGKLQEIKEIIRRENVNVLITYHELKPRQHFNLEKELGITVMDRVELILEIFDKRAGTKEAKLQIELARLKHRLPLIREYIRLAKIGEQIGYHGAGEYAVEAYYRYVRNRIATITRELKEIRSKKKMLITKRKEESGLPEIVLTGYTMAGKTTLFNKLTKHFKYRDGRPFATLSTYSRVIDLDGLKAVLTDTIGFIDDLPPLLIEAFYATIEEIAHADLILLILDVSEDIREFRRKLETSLKVLRDLSIPYSKVLPVLNKIDLVKEPSEIEERAKLVREAGLEEPVAISAEYKIGFDELKNAIIRKLAPEIIEIKAGLEAIPETVFRYARLEMLDGVVRLRVPSQHVQKVVNILRECNVEFVLRNEKVISEVS